MAQDTAAKANPPYISFATFKTFISDLKDQGVPPHIDKHVWRHRFAGNVGPYLISTLRFLGLLTPNDDSTDELKAFADAYGTDRWRDQLGNAIRRGYAPVLALDLKTIAAGHLTDFFGQTYELESHTLRKAVTFFIHAAKDANLDLSPRILKTTRSVAPRQRSVSANGSKPKKEKEKDTGSETPDRPPVPPVGSAVASWHQMLLDKFPAFDPAWPDDVKAKWFEGFQQLMAKGNAK